MNNDLISRAEAIKVFEDYACDIPPMEAIDEIRCLPAVDAEPVRHAHWVHCKGKSNLWYCSGCGEKIIYNPTRKTYGTNKKAVHEVNKRCRSCGAKMGAEVK